MPKDPAPLPLWARIIDKGLILYFVVGMTAAAGLAHQTWPSGQPLADLLPTIEQGRAA